jgi:probable F420-dependent oxidoreductase
MTRPNLFIGLPAGDRLGADDPARMIDLSRRSEDAGADGIVVTDHVLLGTRLDRYQWGKFPFGPDVPWLEPLTMLTAMAMATERITLTTGILIVPLRPAALLAKLVATLDVISGGRFELGAGTGWQEEEFTAQGVDYAKRGQIMNETIAACRELWGSSPASFHSETVSFDDVWSEPKPVRAGGPRVLFSGTLTQRNVSRIVELGDGWIPIMGETVEGLAAGVVQLRASYEKAGRDPSELRVRGTLPIERGADGAPSLTATLAGADALAGIGVTDAQLPMVAFVRDDDGISPFFRELASRWG